MKQNKLESQKTQRPTYCSQLSKHRVQTQSCHMILDQSHSPGLKNASTDQNMGGLIGKIRAVQFREFWELSPRVQNSQNQASDADFTWGLKNENHPQTHSAECVLSEETQPQSCSRDTTEPQHDISLAGSITHTHRIPGGGSQTRWLWPCGSFLCLGLSLHPSVLIPVATVWCDTHCLPKKKKKPHSSGGGTERTAERGSESGKRI